MAQVSQATKDYKIKYRANILELFPQFSENETLISECTSKDSLSHMSSLCTAIQHRHTNQTSEDCWSHIVNLLNEALVKRLQAKGPAKNISHSAYSLKSEDFRDAHHAAKLRTANLAYLFVMARELNMIEGPDGIMVRQAALPSKRAQSVRSSDGSSLRSSATSQKPTQSNISRLPRAPAAPSRSSGAFDRRLHKTYFNDLKHSDLMITLSDRSLYVHCVVICRVSECFDLLLENNHKGSNLELKEDDAEAMMVLLRHMYDLPYTAAVHEKFSLLQHHALISVVAVKYQYRVLEVEACETIKGMVDSHSCSLEDFLQAIRIIFAPTTRSRMVSACLVAACVADLRLLKQNAGFLSLLREFPELGFEILGHQDLESALPEAGEWEGE